MAYIGTPSFFVHHNKAGYDDLGMIVKYDPLLVIYDRDEGRQAKA